MTQSSLLRPSLALSLDKGDLPMSGGVENQAGPGIHDSLHGLLLSQVLFCHKNGVALF